eukprot:c10321_g1_i1.p1 GENE.c10321_g1_i1~~c10321_g1_i1.p1  ORF type:complete len:138 (+),score=44.25 c10321_g1_i1:53-466(+)
MLQNSNSFFRKAFSLSTPCQINTMIRQASGILNPEVRRLALEKSKEVRLLRKEFKENISKNGVSFTDAINQAQANDSLKKVFVKQIIMSFPKFGKMTAEKILAQADVDVKTRVAKLQKEQSVKISNLIEEKKEKSQK